MKKKTVIGALAIIALSVCGALYAAADAVEVPVQADVSTTAQDDVLNLQNVPYIEPAAGAAEKDEAEEDGIDQKEAEAEIEAAGTTANATSDPVTSTAKFEEPQVEAADNTAPPSHPEPSQTKDKTGKK